MTEMAIVSNDAAMCAHRELYHLQDDAYIFANNDLLKAVSAAQGYLGRLHIASTWTDILKLALWKKDPAIGDVLVLLRNAGISPDELLPFRDADIRDIFPWLYYGRRFNVLRKICHIAKVNSEKHISNRDVRVHCHIVSEDVKLIVASTL